MKFNFDGLTFDETLSLAKAFFIFSFPPQKTARKILFFYSKFNPHTSALEICNN